MKISIASGKGGTGKTSLTASPAGEGIINQITNQSKIKILNS